MSYTELFTAVGTELIRGISGRLFTEEQIRSVTNHAVGKHLANFLPEPMEEQAARERVEEAREHIAKASNIISQLQIELGSQTKQLDLVLVELEEKKKLAHKYETLAKTSQEQFSALKSEMESALRQELIAQSEKGKGVRRLASAVIWLLTLIIGAALGTYFKETVALLQSYL